jgi:hypothetical protein
VSTPQTQQFGKLFREYGEPFIAFCRPSFQAIKVIRSIRLCRTPALGGTLITCTSCDNYHFIFKSCGNRYCPLCQNIKKEIWLDKMVDLTLPVGYFHTVFTLPSQLRALTKQNQKVCYNILFRSAWQALSELCEEELGIKPGMISMLHTWGQNLSYHPHVHTIIPNGGIDIETGKWRKIDRKLYLIAPSHLRERFKTIFIKKLREAFDNDELKWNGERYDEENVKELNKTFNEVKEITWVVWNGAPAKGVEQIYEYLGRYVHRIAMADSRILEISNNKVTFSYKDYRKEDGQNKPVVKEMTLSVFDFIKKFLQHILPPSFQKVRYYGVLSSAGRPKLKAIQEELKVVIPPKRTTAQIIEKLIGAPVDVCQNCGAIGSFVTVTILANPYWIFDNCKHLSQRYRPPPRLGSKVVVFDPLLAKSS